MFIDLNQQKIFQISISHTENIKCRVKMISGNLTKKYSAEIQCIYSTVAKVCIQTLCFCLNSKLFLLNKFTQLVGKTNSYYDITMLMYAQVCSNEKRKNS